MLTKKGLTFTLSGLRGVRSATLTLQLLVTGANGGSRMLTKTIVVRR